MLKLHKIEFEHYSPKDRESGIKTWVVFDGTEQELMPLIDKKHAHGLWKDRHRESLHEPLDVYNEKFEKVGTETYYERMLRVRGTLHDDNEEFSDLYYGKTIWGWDEGQDVATDMADHLIQLGIAEDWRGQRVENEQQA